MTVINGNHLPSASDAHGPGPGPREREAEWAGGPGERGARPAGRKPGSEDVTSHRAASQRAAVTRCPHGSSGECARPPGGKQGPGHPPGRAWWSTLGERPLLCPKPRPGIREEDVLVLKRLLQSHQLSIPQLGSSAQRGLGLEQSAPRHEARSLHLACKPQLSGPLDTAEDTGASPRHPGPNGEPSVPERPGQALLTDAGRVRPSCVHSDDAADTCQRLRPVGPALAAVLPQPVPESHPGH